MSDEFTLEKLKIHERLAGIESKFDAHMKAEENVSKDIRDILKRHDELLLGNGKDGMTVRVDRLEIEHESRKWHFRSLWAIMVGVLANIVVTFFK